MFPEKLYVYEERDGEDTWYVAEESLRRCAKPDQSVLVGVYQFAEAVQVKLEVKVEESLQVEKAA